MAKTKAAWSITKLHNDTHQITFENVKGGWEQWVLVMADEHWDNPKCNLELLKKHHDEAKERGAIILKFGDTFCAMQGKYDKRSSKNDIREEHQNSNYLDSLVTTAAEWYKPYGDNIALITYGNHETAIRNHHETDLCERLVVAMRANGSPVQKGMFAGWVKFCFHRDKQKISRVLNYHHGWGGGGPVTKGGIDFNRLTEYIDADFFVMGHVHYKETYPVPRVRLNMQGRPVKSDMQMIRCGTYKDEYGTGGKSWHIEKGRGPRPLGGYWLKFKLIGHDIETEITEAK